MHRAFPPPPPKPPLKPRTPGETRAIMGPNYNPHLPWDTPRRPSKPPDAIDEEEEAEDIAEALGPVLAAEMARGSSGDHW